MKNASVLGRYLDTLLRFMVTLITYPCWAIIAIIVMFNTNFHPDLGNYWFLVTAFIYCLSEKCDLPSHIVGLFKGKWAYSNSRTYHQKQWKFVLNNLYPLAGLPIARLIVFWFPSVPFNTNGLTFLAMLLTIITANHEANSEVHNEQN